MATPISAEISPAATASAMAAKFVPLPEPRIPRRKLFPSFTESSYKLRCRNGKPPFVAGSRTQLKTGHDLFDLLEIPDCDCATGTGDREALAVRTPGLPINGVILFRECIRQTLRAWIPDIHAATRG